MVRSSKPRLFISHSTNGELFFQQSKDLLEQLKSSMQGDWEVFVDTQSIKPGDPWRQRIVNAMQHADAAIILFDRVSVNRPWVRAESSVFTFRYLVSPKNFKVLPIFLDGLRHDNVEFGFCEPFQLNEISGINVSDQLSSDILEMIRNSLPLPSRIQSYGGWIVEMTEGLQGVSAPRLKEAFSNPSLARSFIEWEAEDVCEPDACRLAGSQILHHFNIAETVACFRYILGGISSPQHANSARRVYPTKWADNAAIQKLINACHTSSPDSFGIEYWDANMLALFRDRIKIETCETIRVCCIDNATSLPSSNIVDYVIDLVYQFVCPYGPIFGNDGNPMPPADCIAEHVKSHNGTRVICFVPRCFLSLEFLNKWRSHPSGISKCVVLVFLREFNSESTPWEDFGVQTLKPQLNIDRLNGYLNLRNELDSI